MATPKRIQNQTYELLARELIDRFPEREERRRNNTKRRQFKKEHYEEKQDWSSSWERQREIRAKERQRRFAGFEEES